MPRNPWLKTRSSTRICRINKKFTLPAFSYPCGFLNRSLSFDSGATTSTNLAVPGVGSSLAAAFTLDFWFKPLGFAASQQYLVSQWMSNGGVMQVRTILLNGMVVFAVRRGAAFTSITSNDFVANGAWNHVSCVFNGTTTSMYLNGRLQTSTGAAGGTLDTDVGALYDIHIGSNVLAQNLFIGEIDEIRIWDRAFTFDEIIFKYNKRRDSAETDLLRYFKMDDTGFTITESVGGTSATIPLADRTSVLYTDDVYAPLKLGVSFAAAEYAITVAGPCSLLFPYQPPDDCNFMPVVRWVDDDEVCQRRKLWSLDGVDIAPMPADYNGEVLPVDFVIEIWNIDGEESVDMAEDMIISTSITTLPTHATDQTQIVITIPVADSSLAQLFPLTFPATFNTQQTY